VPVDEVDRDALMSEIRATERAVAEAKEEAERWRHTELLEQLKVAATQFAQPPSTAAH
jgi:hypothetical protein